MKNTIPSSNGPADNRKAKTNNTAEKTRINKPHRISSTKTTSSVSDNAAADTKPTITTQLSTELPPIRKMERAHSFFLTRKLSQIYNNLTTGSKENLTKIAESSEPQMAAGSPPTITMPPPPFKFTRSLSMASIPIRQSFRRVFRENKLEKLHEENSSEKVDAIVAAAQIEAKKPVGRTSMDSKVDAIGLRSRYSFNANNDNVKKQPQAETKPRERRSSFRNTIYELGRTISGHNDKPITTRWSTSLASLQRIDTMVSYEDLSFIDYDKFNTYEQMLTKQRRHQETNQSNDKETRSTCGIQSSPTMSVRSVTMSLTPIPSVLLPSPIMSSTSKVVRRRKQHIQTTDYNPCQQPQVEQNFDQPKNLYRQSLDDNKLKLLQRANRQSIRLSGLYGYHSPKHMLQQDHVRRSVSQQTLKIGGDGDFGDNQDFVGVTEVDWSTPDSHGSEIGITVRSKSWPELQTSDGFLNIVLGWKQLRAMVSRVCIHAFCCYIIVKIRN